MTRRQALLLCAPLAALPFAAHAQWSPDRPVRLVVPFAAGGITDILARAVAEPLAARLGQPVVVENRPGGGGNVAGELVARAPADGQMVLFASQGMVVMNAALYAQLSYDPTNDFVPVAMAARQPNVIVANPRLVTDASLGALLERARREPGRITYGSPAAASFAHISGERLRFQAGVDITHVPYRGSAPMLTDLIAGNIALGVDAIATSMPHIRAGTLRALAVTSPERFRALPDVPAVAEFLPGYDANAWYGAFVRRDTPEAVLARLDAELRAVMTAAPFLRLLEDRQADPMPEPRPALLARMREEQRIWREVIQRSGARAE
ncbi:MAG: tripartite tricarboxylate transporter substrate-binding protein [Alphaproteobacteria bacterium]|nr:tripartite tricarboxylate transporter substrate-binding protein [Alphaproteobacteria bacterium]